MGAHTSVWIQFSSTITRVGQLSMTISQCVKRSHHCRFALTTQSGISRSGTRIALGFQKIRSVATRKELMGTKRKSMVGLHVPWHAVLAWKLADLRLKRSWCKQL